MTNIFNNNNVYESSTDAFISLMEQASSELRHNITFSSSLVTDDDEDYENYDPLPMETTIDIDINDLTEMFPFELSCQDNYGIPIKNNEINLYKSVGITSCIYQHNPQMKYLRTDIIPVTSTYHEKEMLDSYPNTISTSNDTAIPSFIDVVTDDMETKVLVLDSSYFACEKDVTVPLEENKIYHQKLDDKNNEYETSYRKDSTLVHSSFEEISTICSNAEIKYHIDDAMTRLRAYQSKQPHSSTNNHINTNFNNSNQTRYSDLNQFYSTYEVNNAINKSKNISGNEVVTSEDYSENKSPISVTTYETQKIVSPDRKSNHQNQTHDIMNGSSSDNTTITSTSVRLQNKNCKRYKSKRKPRPKVEVLPLSTGPIHEVQDDDVLCGRGGMYIGKVL